jgi:hypothetical protein
MNEQPRITDELLDQIADRDAEVARISVLRRLVGLPVRGRAGARIDRALEAHGLRALAPTSARRAG